VWRTTNAMKISVILAKLMAVGLLLWALADAPTQHAARSAGHRHIAYAAGHDYGYYVLLRWAVCGGGGLGAFRAAGFGKKGWAWTLGIVAVFFNPIAPVHLTRETWAFIDVGVTLLLLVSIIVVDLRPPSTRSVGGNANDSGQGQADPVE
jgi:hypothetical protein